MKLVRLGPTRLKILRLVMEGRKRNMPPTIRELRNQLGQSSTNAVHEHLKALRKLGLVTWEECQGRTLQSEYIFVPAEDL